MPRWLGQFLRAMLGWLGQLLRAMLALALQLALGLLLIWQALILAFHQGMGASAVLCAVGLLLYLSLMGVHELGHLVAGWAMGLPFVRLKVGLLAVEREGERLRVRLNTAWFKQALFVERKPVWGRDGAARWAGFVLGGPLANLLLGAACLAGAAWLSPGPPADAPRRAVDTVAWFPSLYPGDLLTACLNFAGLLSLARGLSELVPATVGRWRSDGGQLLDLWRYRRVARATGYSTTAVLLVASALAELSQRRRKERGEAVHLSARELCEYLLVAHGEEAEAELRACDLRRSEDVGRVMSGLVNAGMIARRGPDSESDFNGLFALE
jgi:uncharacterized repeat protein (TIGR04138 family)